MIESDIERWMRQKIRERGGLFYKFTSPGNDGVPDRILVWRGRVIFIELKQERGRLSRMQELQIERLREHGADVRVVYGRAQAEKLVEEVTG